MAMLSPGQRMKVAEAVLHKPCRLVDGYIAACGPRPDQYHYRWDPGYKITQKDALITKAAQTIDALQVDPVNFAYKRKQNYEKRFISALAANDTTALECLLHELLESARES